MVEGGGALVVGPVGDVAHRVVDVAEGHHGRAVPGVPDAGDPAQGVIGERGHEVARPGQPRDPVEGVVGEGGLPIVPVGDGGEASLGVVAEGDGAESTRVADTGQAAGRVVCVGGGPATVIGGGIERRRVDSLRERSVFEGQRGQLLARIPAAWNRMRRHPLHPSIHPGFPPLRQPPPASRRASRHVVGVAELDVATRTDLIGPGLWVVGESRIAAGRADVVHVGGIHSSP